MFSSCEIKLFNGPVVYSLFFDNIFYSMQSDDTQIFIQKGYFPHPCFHTPGSTQSHAPSHYFLSQKETSSFSYGDQKSYLTSFYQMDTQTPQRSVDGKNKKSAHRVPIRLVNCQTIKNEASKIDRLGKTRESDLRKR